MPKTVNAVPAAFSGPVVASVAPLMEPVKATGLNDEMVPVTPLLVTEALVKGTLANAAFGQHVAGVGQPPLRSTMNSAELWAFAVGIHVTGFVVVHPAVSSVTTNVQTSWA